MQTASNLDKQQVNLQCLFEKCWTLYTTYGLGDFGQRKLVLDKN